jgi:hypothetical protein
VHDGTVLTGDRVIPEQQRKMKPMRLWALWKP